MKRKSNFQLETGKKAEPNWGLVCIEALVS